MVQIQSKQERRIWSNAILGFVPDVLIAWAISYYLQGGLLGFIGTIVGLQCLYLLLWIKKLTWAWLMFWLSGRARMASSFEQYLLQSQFPRPPEFCGGTEDYFLQIANDKDLDCSIRVKAATELGGMTSIRSTGQFMMGLQMYIAFEDALERHALKFPPRSSQ